MITLIETIVRQETQKVLYEIFKRPNNDVLVLGPTAYSKKKKYAKRAWDLIKDKYKGIGGCKSFDDKDGDGGFNDFIYGKYIWRIYFGNSSNDIQSIIVYRPTKFGRKSICSASKNKEVWDKMVNPHFDKSNHVYGEVSGAPEHLLGKNKRTNWIPKELVPMILQGKEVSLEQNPEADKNERAPYDSKKHYYRDLGGNQHRKAMFGHPIIPKICV